MEAEPGWRGERRLCRRGAPRTARVQTGVLDPGPGQDGVASAQGDCLGGRTPLWTSPSSALLGPSFSLHLQAS